MVRATGRRVVSASEVRFLYGVEDTEDPGGAGRAEDPTRPKEPRELEGSDAEPEVDRSKLSYQQFRPGDHDWNWPTTGWALQAAVVAALGALYIGIGIAILLTYA